MKGTEARQRELSVRAGVSGEACAARRVPMSDGGSQAGESSIAGASEVASVAPARKPHGRSKGAKNKRACTECGVKNKHDATECDSCGQTPPFAPLAAAERAKKRPVEGEDWEEARYEKRKRAAVRVLEPIDCVRLGDEFDGIGNNFTFLARLPKPCKLYSTTDVSDTLCSRENLLDFARRFAYAAFEEDYAARVFASDVGVFKHSEDHVSKLLFALMMTNPRSVLDMNRECVGGATLPQWHGDLLSTQMLHGAMTGVEGLACISLWYVDLENAHTPPVVLKVIELIVKASRGRFKDGICIWPCMTTHSTTLQTCTNTVTGGRYETKGNMALKQAEGNFDVNHDIYPTLRSSIAEYRKVSDVVPPERNYKRPSQSERFTDKEAPHDVPVEELFSMFMLQEVHKGLYEDGTEANIIVHEVRIQGNMPGVCPLVLLQQMCLAMPEVKTALKELWTHDMLVLKSEGMLDTNDMFSNEETMSAMMLTTPGIIPLAVQRFAASKAVTNLDCVPRIDVDDQEEVAVYQLMLDEACARARNLYERVYKEMLHDPRRKNAELPVEDFDIKGSDTRGWSIRFVPKARMEAQIALLREETAQNMLTSEGSASRDIATQFARLQDFDSEWLEWSLSQLQDEDNFYFQVLGFKPLTGGICMRINTNHIPKWQDPKKEDWQMRQFTDMSQLAKVYMSIRVQPRTNITEFWKGSGLVSDLDYIGKNLTRRLPSEAIQIYTELIKEASSVEFMRANVMHPREHALNELIGRNGEHAVMQQEGKVWELCDETEVGRMIFKMRKAALKGHIDAMARGDLKQFAAAASVIRDLKKVGAKGELWTRSMSEFFKSFSSFQHPLLHFKDARLGPLQLLNSGWSVLYNEETWKGLNLDINSGNKNLIDHMTYSTTGLFFWNEHSGGYGYPCWLGDGGGAWYVLAAENGVSRLVRVDSKSPGAGADTSASMTIRLDSMTAVHLFGDEISRLHKAEEMKNTVKVKTSPLQGMMSGACGTTRDEFGVLNISEALKADFGGGLICSEMGKVNSRSDANKDEWANIERTFAHSGHGEFLKVELWNTTMNCKQMVVVNLAPGPYFMLCSNRQAFNVPESLLGGGRATCVPSSVAKNAGRLVCNRAGAGEGGRGAKKRRVMNLREVDFAGVKKGEMSKVTASLTVDNCVYFLVSYFMRRALPFVCKGFATKSVCWATYTRADIASLCRDLERLTAQIRRKHIQSPDDFTRNFNGPCKWSTILGVVSHKRATEYCMQAVLDPTCQAEGGPAVHLDEAFRNTVVAHLTMPVDLVSVLSGVYLWLHNCVLDPNLMILSCFLTHTAGMRQHCSLMTMALVMNGNHGGLDQAQLAEYEALCAFLLPVVTQDARLQTNNNDGNVPANSFVKLLPRYMLEPVNLATFTRWCAHEQEEEHEFIRTNAKTRRDAAKGPSTYLSNTIVFRSLSRPQWLIDSDKASKNMRVQSNMHWSTATVGRAVTQTFADLHSTAADEARGDTRAFRQTRLFWRAAKEGTRFPDNSNDTTQEESKLKFTNNEETAVWWETTMKNAGSLQGLLQSFLQMCSFNEQSSRQDVVQRLLQPYLDSKQIRRTVHSSHEWAVPIFSSNGHGLDIRGKSFQMGVHPHVSEMQPRPDGVDLNLGVDVLSFLLLQGLYVQNITRARDHSSHTSLVHHSNDEAAALGIVELLLHTSVPLAEVPICGASCTEAQTGRIFLYAGSPTPLGHGTPASIQFDPRVHMDATTCAVDDDPSAAAPVFRPRQVLLSQARRAGRWMLLENLQSCGHGKGATDGAPSKTCSRLWLSTLLDGHADVCIPKSEGEMSPFPTESVAHMVAVHQLMKLVYQNACAVHHDNRLEFARSMRVYASSLEAKMLSHLAPLGLTHCAVADEMAFIAWVSREEHERSFLFSVKVLPEHCEIRSVGLTHHTSTAVGQAHSIPEYSALPMETKRVPHYALQSVLAGGLMHDPEDDWVRLRMPGQVRCGEAEALPTFMFPVINFRTCVMLQVHRQDIRVWVEDKPDPYTVVMTGLHQVLLRYTPHLLVLDELEQWAQQHEDVDVPTGVRLSVFGVDWELEEGGKRWGPSCKFLLSRDACDSGHADSSPDYLWCNSSADLRFRLRHPDTLWWDALFEHGHHLVLMRDVDDNDRGLQTEDSLRDVCYYQLLKDASADLFTWQVQYDDTEYQQRLRVCQHNESILKTVQQSITHSTNNADAAHNLEALHESKALRERVLEASRTTFKATDIERKVRT